MEGLKRAAQLASILVNQGDDFVIESNHDLFNHFFAQIYPIAKQLHLDGAFTACFKLSHLLNMYRIKHYSPEEMKLSIDRVVEDISIEMKQEVFFHYRRDVADLLRSMPAVWAGVISAFPSSKRDIETGIDCYALGDYSGCVFHMMGLAELGLRTIAMERGVKTVGKKKPLEWGTWQDAFAAIENQLKAMRSKRAGPKRDAALSFYDTALSDLRRLQGYRDPTMHFRAQYDKGEAYDAMHRAQSLLVILSTKLREDRIRKIRWGL